MKYAPIIIFAFNRFKALQNTVENLKRNAEVAESDLFVFVDGARPNKEGENVKVKQVQEYVKTITGFKSLTYKFSPVNKGLGNSIISGVTEIVNQYGRVIVLEDDLVVARGFLSYMNTMLESYKDDKRIMQISGYSTKFKIPSDYPYDIYLNRRGETWSWGTWKESWDLVDWEVKDIDIIRNNKQMQRDFNDIGSDLYSMLEAAVRTGRIWGGKFAYAMFKNNAYQVSPIKSLVRNDGFGEDSTNCNVYNRYEYVFDDEKVVFNAPQNIPYNRIMDKRANYYWTLRARAWGRVQTFFYKHFH